MEADRRYENALVGILFFTWGTVFLDRMSQVYLAPYFAPEFHLSHEQIGTLASVLAITWGAVNSLFRRPIRSFRAATAAPILAGELAEKHGLALTMWFAAAGSAVLFVVTLFA